MIVVADKLAHIAEKEAIEADVDAYGKSAFNRYYYASYLITRELLNQLDPKWATTGHKGIPDLLLYSVRNKINNLLKKQVREELIKHKDAERYKSMLTPALSELANLLKTAYHIRVIADYEPDIKITRSSSKGLSLDNQSLHAAKHWPEIVSRHKSTILSVWRQLAA